MYSTQGIVLKKNPAGEADAVFSVYTKEYGKIRILAQGIKKEEAKLKGHMEMLNLVDMAFVLGYGGERLIQSSSLNCWSSLRNNWYKLSTACYLLESIDRNCFVGEKDENLWGWILESLQDLESVDDKEKQIFYKNILRKYKQEISEILGYGGEENESVNFQ